MVTIAAEYTGSVLLGCLRNATAVAACCRTLGGTVAVIAAGERWTSEAGWGGPLRAAVEDQIGAGAILAALAPRNPSPEAIAAMAAFRAAAADLPTFLGGCTSGRELIEQGFAADVALAAQHDVCQTVPWLRDGRLVAWRAPARSTARECEDSANGGSGRS